MERQGLISILLVEDDADDLFILQHAFSRAAPDVDLSVCRDGEEAVAFLSARATPDAAGRPLLVVLDLKLPRRNGFEVLAWMRSEPVFATLPVVIHSSSQEKRDMDHAYALGANVYLAKQIDLGGLVAVVGGIVAYARAAALARIA